MFFKITQLIFIANLLRSGLLLDFDSTRHYRQSVGYLEENSVQPSEQDVPLQDFFWTGSGDGPNYIKPKDPSSVGTKYPNTVVRTATILATIFIDGNFDEFDPLCVYDCDKKTDGSGIVESFDQIPSTDRRYWLLTVITGLFNKNDFPILEEKLAKLYRIAFLRQQAKHLGITNGNSTIKETVDEHSARKKRSVASKNNKVVKISPTKTLVNGSEPIRTQSFKINKYVYERQMLRMKRQHVSAKRDLPTSPPIHLKVPPPYEIIYRNDDKSKSKKLKAGNNFMRDVSVRIHNITHGDDDSVPSNKIDLSHMSNQTELIYSVTVRGKPVLAITAAEDMELVSTDEVIRIMENNILLKAEPYLKEPLATPLVPPQMRNESGVMETYVNQNPLLIALITLAFILFVLLLLTLLLYGRSKRRLAIEAKRQSATQALVQKINVDDDINTIRSNSLDDVGVENLAFEKEREMKGSDGMQRKEPPILNFPLPPAYRPSSSSSTTSDSSVYYPKRRYNFNSIQDLIEEKGGNADDIYAKLKNSASKLSIRKDSNKVHKHRNRRKYRGDNRVGSLEQINRSEYQSDVDIGYNNDSLKHNEAFNPHVSQYNANKLMADKTFTVIESERKQTTGRGKSTKPSKSAEAVNQELLHQRGATSGDTNSIGSFLSMASIRSFPKCSVPEPLSRVLEPVSVTHLDHSDADYDTIKNYRMMNSQKSLDSDDIDVENERDAQCTQSDGADPGFVGPIVWEMHKKGLDVSTNSLSSPLRDPHVTRNRFEGLLEGAMKLYGSSSYSNCHSLVNQQDDDQLGQMPGVIRSKEARGKSAATIRLTSRTSGLLSRTDFHTTRPKTADHSVNQTQNPITPIHAWTSGSGSALVRPMSAGIYHKPCSTNDDHLKVDRSRAMSASPIIDAIQKELKRISDEK
ncbi:hypothetical protein ACKWTF_006810 [Chironomus riparius]